MEGMTETQLYTVKVMLDDITFMLFDLERGNFIKQEDEVNICEAFSVDYKRELLEEKVVGDWKEIISDFFITVKYYDRQAIKFVTRGADQKFTLFEFDGFVCGMFMNKLDSYRKEKFSINN